MSGRKVILFPAFPPGFLSSENKYGMHYPKMHPMFIKHFEGAAGLRGYLIYMYQFRMVGQGNAGFDKRNSATIKNGAFGAGLRGSCVRGTKKRVQPEPFEGMLQAAFLTYYAGAISEAQMS